MGTLTHITGSFFLSLSLVGVSIYYFIEGNSDFGKLFVFLAIYVFISFFYVFRSLYYLRHKATFNEFIFVYVLPVIPVLILLAQMLFGINEMFTINDAFVLSTGVISTDWIDYSFSINVVDMLLLPYYLASNFLLFRSLIRYPFIRFRGTSEKGMNPKFSGFMLMLLIPALYIASALTYINNFFLLLFGIIYFYLGTIALIV